jgi:hypothetical protein
VGERGRRFAGSPLSSSFSSGYTGVFPEKTGVVLLLSDAIDGVTAIDLDGRKAGRRVITGERAGDQEFRITTTGDHLVVGWGEIYAFPLSRGPSRKIADATIYIPAAEPDQVWTVTWDGERIGVGASTVRRITTDGDVTFSSDALDTVVAAPVLGVPGGLVVRTPEGLAIWNAATATIGPILGPGRAVASSTSNGRSLAWCDNTCADLHVVPLAHPGPPTAAHAGQQQVALANDNHRLAYLRPDTAGGSELVVLDIQTGSETTIAKGLAQYGSIAWSADSNQLFYNGRGTGGRSLTIGRYSPSSSHWEVRNIDVSGNNLGLVVLDRSNNTQRFFTDQLVRPLACPGAATMYPSGRHGTCSFRL